MELKKASAVFLPAKSRDGSFDCAALRRKWALDEEVRIDLSVISQDLLSMMHSGTSAKFPAARDWVSRFRELSNMAPEELSQDRQMASSDADRVLEAFADPSCRAMLSARRRWPMALALAGCVDFKAMEQSSKPAYERMGRLALEWTARNHPGFALRTMQELARPRRVGIDEARLGVVQEVMSALFCFGEDVGMQDQVQALRERAEGLAKRMAWDALRQAGRELPTASFMSQLEAMHLAWAISKAPAAEQAAPKAAIRL